MFLVISQINVKLCNPNAIIALFAMFNVISKGQRALVQKKDNAFERTVIIYNLLVL